VGIAARGEASGVSDAPGTLEADISRERVRPSGSRDGRTETILVGSPRKTTIQTTVSATALETVIGKAATSAVGEIGAVAASKEK
jgi:hypothetical protein